MLIAPPDSATIPRMDRLIRVSLVCSLLFAMTGCSAKPAEDQAIVPRLKVFKVGKQATGQSRRISGRLQAVNKSPLSFGVGGRVIERTVERGQRVTIGQVLARIDPAPLQLVLDKARSTVTSARAIAKDAETSYKRVASLLPSEGASQSEVDEAATKMTSATSDLQAAKGALEQAEIDFGRTELIAPFDGQIVETSVDRFQEVAANATVAVIQADGVLEVSLRVPEKMIAHVDYGQVVQATFPSLEGVQIAGTVALIGAESDSGSGFPVTVRLGKTSDEVRPGMTASVTFNFTDYLEGRTAFLVPLSAVAIDAGLAAFGEPKASEAERSKNVPMFVLNVAKQTVALRKVTVGDLRGNEIEVFEGLKAGDMVVSAGVAFVRDGMKALPWSGKQGSLR